MDIKWEGLDKVLRKLNLEVEQIEERTRAGLIEAGMFVRREAMIKTPVDTGNLVGSTYTVWGGGSFKRQIGQSVGRSQFTGPHADRLSAEHRSKVVAARAAVQRVRDLVVEIGYTAYYAVFVHEIDKNYRKPGSSWKFLELALMRTSAIKRIIVNRIKRG